MLRPRRFSFIQSLDERAVRFGHWQQQKNLNGPRRRARNAEPRAKVKSRAFLCLRLVGPRWAKMRWVLAAKP